MLKSQKKNSLIINNAIELGELTSEANGKGRKFTSRFIEAGVAHYEQFGDVLITKETLDKFIDTMIGVPVIIKHKDITDKNADKERVGVVSRVWYNEADGWFYCEGVIWDKQAIDLVKNQGWNVSCTYDFESDFKKSTYHGKEIDMEFTGGEFLHLALVPNPRYERATIVMNANDVLVIDGHQMPAMNDEDYQCEMSFDDAETVFLSGLKTIIENALDSELSDEDKTVLNGLAEIFCVENEEKWITIKGNHILLKDGESIADAFKRTTGVSFSKSNKHEHYKQHNPTKEYTEILEKVKKGNNINITPEDIINKAVKTFSNKFSEKDLRERIDFADEYNNGIRESKRQTFQLYSNEKGEYKRERAELHKTIINDLFKNAKTAKPKDGQAPTFMILGGRGGSGKGNFGKEGKSCQVYNKQDYIVLDADAIKERLKPYNGYNAFEVHQESSDILTQALAKARKEGLNVVWDGTMKTLGSVEKKLKPFMDSKYNIEMYYMHLPREKAAERAIGRFMESENGRYVPLTELLKMKDNEENFDKLKKYASKWAFYDNDVPFGTDPKLIDKNY